MRVAYLCADPGVPAFGCKGCSVHVQEMLSALLNRGANVELFATRLGDRRPHFLQDLVTHAIPIPSTSNVSDRENLLLAANKFFYEALAAAGPFDLIYERHALWSYAGMEFALHQRVPGILEVNSPLIDEQAKYRRMVNREEAALASYRAMESAGATIGVSRQVAKYIAQYRKRQNDIYVIPNGVNPDRIRSDCEPAQINSPGTFTIGFVGTLKPWHGVEELIKAFTIVFAKHPNVRLMLVGDGPQREHLVAQVSKLPYAMGRAIQLVGAVKPADIPAWLASMDAAVAPYAQMEDFYFSPLKLFEYMAAGLPTVASNVGQIGEVIDDGVTGFLYPPGDSRALAATLLRMIQAPEHRQKMGCAARQAMIRQYTWDAVVTQVLDLSHKIKQDLAAAHRMESPHDTFQPVIPRLFPTLNH